MLHSLRAFAKTWVAKIILGLLLVSMAAFGINNVITNLGGTTVARVGDEEISSIDFQREYNAELNAAAQQTGSLPTAEQAMQAGIPSNVLNTLASQAAINQLSRSLSLGVSEDRLSQMLRDDPNFKGMLGNFDASTFNERLRQLGLTEAEYFDERTDFARRVQLGTALFTDAAVPAAAKTLIQRYLTDKRSIEYFILDESSFPMLPAPTDDDLAAYLAAHQDEFQTTELRSADVLVLTLETLAATKVISPEQIAAEYELTKASLVTTERRLIRQVALPEASLSLFEAGKAEGKTFDQLLTEAGLTPTTLGTLARTEVVDAALAEAAFGLTAGDFVIIDGVSGRRAVNVVTIEPGGQVSLEEASPAISNRLALAAARTEYLDVLDQIEELRASFQPLPDIAQRFGLPLTPVTVSASGTELSGVPGLAPGDAPRVAQGIFAADPSDDLTPTIQLNANKNVWFDLKTVDAARPQTLDEVRDAVAAAWTTEQVDVAIATELELIKADLAAGTPLADIAVSHLQSPVTTAPFTRDGDGSPFVTATVASAVFAGGPNHFGSAIDGNGDHLVFKVTEAIDGKAEIDPATAGFVENSARESLFGEFVNGIKNEAGLRINQQVLNQLLALGTGQ
ncbi:MAG: PpiD [Devosia sp.]|nr:PpiD [Devosia sp.]